MHSWAKTAQMPNILQKDIVDVADLTVDFNK